MRSSLPDCLILLAALLGSLGVGACREARPSTGAEAQRANSTGGTPVAEGGAAGVGDAAAGGSGGGGSGARELARAGAVQAPGTAAGAHAGRETPDSTAAFVYVSGSNDQISVYVLDQQTGVLTARGEPVSAPNPTFLAFAPDGKYLYSANRIANTPGLGTGAVSSFRIDAATGALTFINRVSSQGDGPAHVAVDHTGKYVFVANYTSGTIAVLPVDADGKLGDAVEREDHGATAQAHEVVIDPSNQFLFVPNKGLSNVSQYRFDATRGSLTPSKPPAVALAAGAGSRHLAFHPRLPFAYLINELDATVVTLSFNAAQGTFSPTQTLPTLPPGVDGTNNTCAEIQVAPSGNFVYGSNRGHDSIVIYAVNPKTGMLSLVGHQAAGGKTPRSFHLEQSGKFLLVANQGSDEVVTFRVDATSGLLTELSSVSVRAPAFVGVLYLPLP